MNEEQVRKIFREELIKILGNEKQIPLDVERALKARGFWFSKTTPTTVTQTLYVASSSGGAVTSAVVFVDGLLHTVNGA